MSRWGKPCLLSTLALWGSVACVVEEDLGVAEEAITNGENTDDKAVGLTMIISDWNTRTVSESCSQTFIADQCAVTAAHCKDNTMSAVGPSILLHPSKDVTVYKKDVLMAPRATRDGLLLHPKWQELADKHRANHPNAMQADLALVRYSQEPRPWKGKPHPIWKATDHSKYDLIYEALKAGDMVGQVGYGSSSRIADNSGTQRMGIAVVASHHPAPTVPAGAYFTRTTNPDPEQAYFHMADGGDSGGAMGTSKGLYGVLTGLADTPPETKPTIAYTVVATTVDNEAFLSPAKNEDTKRFMSRCQEKKIELKVNPKLRGELLPANNPDVFISGRLWGAYGYDPEAYAEALEVIKWGRGNADESELDVPVSQLQHVEVRVETSGYLRFLGWTSTGVPGEWCPLAGTSSTIYGFTTEYPVNWDSWSEVEQANWKFACDAHFEYPYRPAPEQSTTPQSPQQYTPTSSSYASYGAGTYR